MQLRGWITTLFAGIVISASLPLLADSTLRCESKGGRRVCRVEEPIDHVEMRKQRSFAECVEGQSWGYDSHSVWVDNGCRADFNVFSRRAYDRGIDRERGRRRLGDRLICESDGGRHFCAADTSAGVSLARTLGDRDCIQGRTWDVTDRGVWVDRGCRAEFVIGTEEQSHPRDRDAETPATLVCESGYGDRKLCPANVRYGVELTRQLSRTDCVFKKTWGYDREGVWVSNGCRAEFLIRGR